MRWVTFVFYAVASFFLGVIAYSYGIGYFGEAVAGEGVHDAMDRLVFVLTLGAPIFFVGAAIASARGWGNDDGRRD